MNAGIAGKLIAKFIDKRWPDDKQVIYDVLRLACNKAWKEGKFLGMTQELFVPVQKDHQGQSFIIAPTTHPVLLAMNGLELKTPIRNEYFMFHRNGYGDIRSSAACQWNTDVYDLGYTPVLDKNNIISDGVRIGVRSLGLAGPDEYVVVSGSNHGSTVYTYQSSEALPNCCGCEVDPDGIDRINGIKISLKENQFTYINNVCFTDIQSITKTLTRNPIEVVVISKSGNATPVATLSPNQRASEYRKYLVPSQLCGRKALHGLFKIAKQEEITSDTDSILLRDEESIISLAIGIYNMYHTTNLEKGANYVLQGVSDLEKEKREERSPDEFGIQVDGLLTDDLSQSLQRFS